MDDLYRGLLSDSGRVVLWGILITALSLIASGAYAMSVALGFCIATLLVAYLLGIFFKPNVVLRREFPDQAMEGSVLNYRIEVTNNGRRTARQLIIEERGLVPELRPTSQPAEITAIPPGESRWVTLKLNCLRRGVYSLDRLQVSSVLPTGFTKVGRVERIQCKIVVLPSFSVIRVPKLIADSNPRKGQGIANGTVGQSSEFLSVRQWRSGDQLRDVHWRSTARTGELIAKEFQSELSVQSILFLDLEARSAADEVKVDRVISFAASVVKQGVMHQYGIELIATCRTGLIEATIQNHQDFELSMEALAGAESVSRNDWAALEMIVKAQDRVQLIILVFTKWDKVRSEMVKDLRSRGYLIWLRVEGESRLSEEVQSDEMIEVFA